MSQCITSRAVLCIPSHQFKRLPTISIAIKSIWTKYESLVSYRIASWMNTKCIAFWNRISVAAAIAQFLYCILRNSIAHWNPRIDGTRSHTNQRNINTLNGLLCDIKDAYIIACGKIDIQNRVNVTVLHRFDFLLHQSMTIFRFINWNRSTSCQQSEAVHIQHMENTCK